MNKIKNTLNFIKSHYIISSVVLLVLLVIGFKLFSDGNSKIETYKVGFGDVVQKVIVTGKTKPVNSVDLGFEVGGTVASSFVKVGSRVYVGEPLVSLDQGGVYAELLKAEANLQSEEARLDELKKGTRPEEIIVAETTVRNAETTLNNAKENFANKVIDIVNNKIDQLFSNPYTNNPQFNLSLNDLNLKNNIEFERLKMQSILNRIYSGVDEATIEEIGMFIEDVAKAVNSQNQTANLSQTTIDGYKSALSSAKSTFITAKETLNSAESSLVLAKNNLDLKKSGSTPESIRAQEARVLQSKAQVTSVKNTISKMTLRSPQNGIVTKQDAKNGEAITAGKILISIISDSNLEIESNVSEINIGKVFVGNPVDITMDAFPGEKFEGIVTYIEPAETLIDNVVNYKITIAFAKEYPQVKSGLTANLEIKTSTKTNVLRIPEYSIIKKSNGNFVSKVIGRDMIETPVSLGIFGNDGFVEVLSGLTEGDTVNAVSVSQ